MFSLYRNQSINVQYKLVGFYMCGSKLVSTCLEKVVLGVHVKLGFMD